MAKRATITNSDQCERLVLETFVNLVRQVPWGPGRAALEAKATSLSREASIERGWDNYSTAAHLDWQATLYKLAAEVRFPRAGDAEVGRMHDRIVAGLKARHTYDDDIGERTRVFRNGVAWAIPTAGHR